MSVGLQPRGGGRAAKSLFLSSRHLSIHSRRLIDSIVMVNAMCAATSPSDLTSPATLLPKSTSVLTQPCFRMLMDNITSRLLLRPTAVQTVCCYAHLISISKGRSAKTAAYWPASTGSDPSMFVFLYAACAELAMVNDREEPPLVGRDDEEEEKHRVGAWSNTMSTPRAGRGAVIPSLC